MPPGLRLNPVAVLAERERIAELDRRMLRDDTMQRAMFEDEWSDIEGVWSEVDELGDSIETWFRRR